MSRRNQVPLAKYLVLLPAKELPPANFASECRELLNISAASAFFQRPN
jgi:hypothetical protein